VCFFMKNPSLAAINMFYPCVIVYQTRHVFLKSTQSDRQETPLP
jgi:hypothetical protein